MIVLGKIINSICVMFSFCWSVSTIGIVLLLLCNCITFEDIVNFIKDIRGIRR